MMADSGKSGRKRSKAGCGTETAEATKKRWRKRLLPLLVCLAFVPAPVALAANGGGQDNVPNAGDYGNDTPSGNDVMIDSDVSHNVVGGYAAGGVVKNNRVTMIGGIVGADAGGYVFGGYAGASGEASANTVAVSGGTVSGIPSGARTYGGDIYGGLVTDGIANDNQVTVSGNTQVDAHIYGGRIEGEGSASGNSVVVSDAVEVKNVYGANVQQGNAAGNTVMIRGGEISGTVDGGYAINGSANDNRVLMSDGSVEGNVEGGNVGVRGSAVGNRVMVSGGEVARIVRGGVVTYGTSSDNVVTVTDAQVGEHVTGGYVYDGTASGNSVTVSGRASVGQNVTGGYIGNEGKSIGNLVTIADNATVNGDIYGGYVLDSSGTATEGDVTGNTVTLATGAGANLAGATVYGGYSNVAGADIKTGNTLNIHTGHVEVKNIADFQTVNFNVNANTLPAAGQAMLALNDTAGTDLSGTQVNMRGAIAGGGQAQPVATTVTLIRNTNGLTTDANTLSGTATIKQGVSLDHHYTLQADNNTLTAIYDGTNADPATGVFTNGRLATVGFLNEGTDFALDTGMARAMETIRVKGYGVYGAIRGSDIRHDLDKGGDAEVSGTHWLLGLAGKLNTARDYDLIGSIYAEAGWGNIDSDNSFASGHGDTHYYGIGLIGRYQQNEGTMKGAYAQINAKIGRASTDLESNLYDVNGNRGEYDEDSTYYGAGVGVGYLWDIASAYQLDLSARYQWLHLDGYNTDIANDPYHFDDIDSHRTRVGARLNYTENKQYTPYIGVAWEHEFSGSARGNVYGYSLDDNSLKGDTGVAEIGVTFSPTADSAWKIDANLQGYAGQREGVAGNLVVNYLF